MSDMNVRPPKEKERFIAQRTCDGKPYLDPGEAHGAHKTRSATRRAKLRRDTKNRVAPLGMTAGRRAARFRRTGPTAAGETQAPFGRMAIPGRNRRFRSGHEQGFGVLLGDHQEFERGLPRAAGALLPTAHGVGAHVQEGGEQHLLVCPGS